MAALTVQHDPFIYSCKDYTYNMEEEKPNPRNVEIYGEYWESPPSSAAQAAISSPETCGSPTGKCRRKRRRVKPTKNKEEMENQRMTHIAVERNRRRQMNDYLAVLRSIMPPSYTQRGDQASIVGGAINFVKELEQLQQFLEANNQQQPNEKLFSKFFTFPQYSTCPSTTTSAAVDAVAERRSSIADIEVMMVESHANIKLSTKRRPKQLLKLVAGFQSIGLTILHLNITTVDQSVLYSLSVKVEVECQFTTVNEIATTVHDIVGMIQEESICS
ncbi:transcription factor bHLH94-like [Salvia miltiorrhiza]|uniref:Basic helix-loop-helix transcription factor n=1 Tax=Salvia miltiorrhiza TaxID=226208 RepID=A0A0H3Y8U2_SALMI|nr:transcription factor bHLH94-like [Salvia miltiorrhiza]XP_057783846.1 transcription factor bHLH94-like [Salvia miltiorrhiza]AKN09575.1 basic helix-loop-helix transcription factor [Salvia miltiorrhiza]